MSDAVNISRRAKSANKAPLFEPYSKVIVHVGLSTDGGEEITYTAGDDTGRTLEVNNEWGTQQMANTILARICGFQYQPFQAIEALVDPAVELGDGITVNGIYSGMFVQATKFGPLMKSDVSAPVDEEIEHEYGFESRTDRAYTRMVAQTRSGISMSSEAITAEVYRATEAEGALGSRITETAESITAEVTRATTAEGTLRSSITQTAESLTAEITRATTAEGNLSSSIQATADSITTEVKRAKDAEGTLKSSITQNANSISAEVTRAKTAEGNKLNHTYSNSSFGWQLTSTAFILKSNNQEVFKANSGGITVKGSGEFSGKITATSGYIGNGSNGFQISNTSISNGMTSLGDTQHNGVYIGTDGIALGAGKFKVTSAGAVTATNLSLTGGSININDKFIVDSQGAVTATNLAITGGSIKLGGTATNPAFSVTSAGAVTASDLSITGGSININNAFMVDSSGNLTATSGTFSGNVYAGNIQYGGSYGTFNGAGLTQYSVSGGYGGQLGVGTIIGGNVAEYTLTGGTGGNIGLSTVAYGNTGFTGTLDQVGTNTSDIAALASYFNSAYANSVNAYTVRARDALYYQGYLVRLYTVKDTNDSNRTVLGLY